MQLSEQAKECKRDYYRKWRRNNRDKVKEAQRRYWERQAEKKAVNGR